MCRRVPSKREKDSEEITSYSNIALPLGNGFNEANTAIERLDLRDNLFEASQDNNSLCNLISRSHLVYLNLSNCGLEGMCLFPQLL